MKKSLRFCVLLVLAATLLTVSAFADTGPKPQLTVKVTNPPEELYFTENPACALTLVEAGLGFTLLPDVAAMRHPRLIYVPVEDAGALSYGLYYKSLKDQPVLKDFISFMREPFSAKAGGA